MSHSHVKPPQFEDSIFLSFFEENTWDALRNVAVACASIENLQVARIFRSRINVDETTGVSLPRLSASPLSIKAFNSCWCSVIRAIKCSNSCVCSECLRCFSASGQSRILKCQVQKVKFCVNNLGKFTLGNARLEKFCFLDMWAAEILCEQLQLYKNVICAVRSIIRGADFL